MFYAADSEQQLTVMTSSREDAFLDAGIDRLPDVLMRRVLEELCTFSSSARKEIKIVVLGELATHRQQGSSVKRKAVETCLTCGEDYAVEQNNLSACRFHPAK